MAQQQQPVCLHDLFWVFLETLEMLLLWDQSVSRQLSLAQVHSSRCANISEMVKKNARSPEHSKSFED